MHYTLVMTERWVLEPPAPFPQQVEARGLKPNTKYFYQWRYRQNDRKAPVYSTIGRTRTLPRADEDIKRVRLSFFGCSQLVGRVSSTALV